MKLVILCLLFLFLTGAVFAQEPYKNVSSVIHIQSKISDGRFTIKEITSKAREKGIRVVVITDTLLRRWEYSVWPLSRVLSRVYEESSIIKSGVKNYLREIASAQNEFPAMLIIPGAEVAPFYYWRGNYFNNTLAIHSWHKKILVLGLKNADDYRNMPVVSSYLPVPKNLHHLLDFWPVVIIPFGFWLTRFKRKRRFSFGGQVFSNISHPFRLLGYFLIALGGFFLLSIFRLPVSKFDPFHGEQGIKPYQALIDYANEKNALTFWTHPEASLESSFAGARVRTPPYKNDLIKSIDYTGFAGIYYDNSTATIPGDLWDKLLILYCQGKRQKPIWVFGEVGWDGSKESWPIAGIETILLLKDFNQAAVIDALRNGRMFAKLNRRENKFSLDKFCVYDDKKNCAFMGDEIRISGSFKVMIKAGSPDSPLQETNIKLIKDGKIIKEFKARGGKIAIIFKDNDFAANKKSFYRLEINNDDCWILTNPIFVSLHR